MKFLIILLTTMSLASTLWASSATYEVTFQGEWTQMAHPTGFPQGSDHFSPPVLVSHSSEYSLFAIGSLASPGVQQVAESGKTDVLIEELMRAENYGSVLSHQVGEALPQGIASSTMKIEVDSSFPLVSLVSMVAPSPDWFVGVDDVMLFDGENFRDEVIFKVYAVDAGTDSGTDFKSGDLATHPHQAIGRVAAPYFTTDGESQPIGEVQIKRIH